MSTTYYITVQEQPIIALLDTGANISVMLQNIFKSLPQKPKLLKSHMHIVMSANRANLGQLVNVILHFS